MVDRHAVQEMLSAGLSAGEVARHFGISSRTVRRIRSEARVGTVDDRAGRRERRVGRPGVASRVPERMRALMEADPRAPRQEILRRLREEGVKVGQRCLSTRTGYGSSRAEGASRRSTPASPGWAGRAI
jgi:transposase-like protein